MSFSYSIEKVVDADMEEISNLFAASFLPSQPIKTLFDGTDSRGVAKWFTACHTPILPNEFAYKAIDKESGRFISYCKFVMSDPSVKERPDPQLPAGIDEARLKDFFAIMRQNLKAIQPSEPYAELNIMATHPDYERRGIARAVITRGLQDTESRICIISASATGRPLYEKLGWKKQSGYELATNEDTIYNETQMIRMPDRVKKNGFDIMPLTDADADELTDIFLLSFLPTQPAKTLHDGVLPADAAHRFKAGNFPLQANVAAYKAVDASSGRIAACAIFVHPKSPGQAERPKVPPPKGCDEARWKTFYTTVKEKFESTNMLSKPHVFVNLLMTHPDFERRGLGSSLIQHGMSRSGQYPIVLSASETGMPLYRKLGWQAKSSFDLTTNDVPTRLCKETQMILFPTEQS